MLFRVTPTCLLATLLLPLLLLLLTVLLLSRQDGRGFGSDIHAEPPLYDLGRPADTDPAVASKSTFNRQSDDGWFSHFFKSETPGIPAMASAGHNVIMQELGNATLRAELGHSTWRLLHTMAARFPRQPTEDEQLAAVDFLHLLSRLYPCGQCAQHFQLLLAEFPPQTKTRAVFMQWTCEAHNIVNQRLGKEQFDCATVSDRWKCGCADDDSEDHKNDALIAPSDNSSVSESGVEETSSTPSSSGAKVDASKAMDDSIATDTSTQPKQR